MASALVIPPVGFVDLRDKALGPVCERPEAALMAVQHALNDTLSNTALLSTSRYFAFTRAVVDVSAFKKLLATLPADAWDDEKAHEENVKLTRPAHDAWGIKKIVFTFCDDFLQKVLDLPFSQQPKWREVLLPIYKAIGIPEHRIVRSLLASMPPGMSIPVHHDTGYWVKHTHRLHVAIESGEGVDFFVGPTNESLLRYSFSEGRIVELNNQAKHAVTNGMTDKWRVHLIFDYVDSDYPIQSRYVLQPGEVVHQTRRSIDLKREVGSRPTPSFLIIGAQKSGTTSLYEHICQHPLVLKGKRRETHYFDWRWNNKIDISDGQRHLECYLNFYEQQTLHKHPSLISGESTPSYLLHSDIVIDRVKRVCPWVKLLVILRDPVERAYSQYQMCIDSNGTEEQLKVRGMSSYIGKSFEQIVAEEIRELKEVHGVCAATLGDGSATKGFSLFLSTRPLTHGGHSIVARGLYYLQLLPWLQAFDSNQIAIYSISDLKGDKKQVQSDMDKVFSFIGVPPHEIEDLDAKNTRNYISNPMTLEVKERLRAFYEPFNKKLCELLQKDFMW